ncbi:unnamed protein product [Angiostrongylus costaricensis]|uniref:SCP domain-containing protein n=1 Tax=Angiostrongylus costaricensis TaxID=334426 RepID=A0A158PEB1_ANGCS|nr:unnamed protein product [Angiostrongylus costaricensis]
MLRPDIRSVGCAVAKCPESSGVVNVTMVCFYGKGHLYRVFAQFTMADHFHYGNCYAYSHWGRWMLSMNYSCELEKLALEAVEGCPPKPPTSSEAGYTHFEWYQLSFYVNEQ